MADRPASPSDENPCWIGWRLFNKFRWQKVLPDQPPSLVICSLDQWLASAKKDDRAPLDAGLERPPTAPRTPEKADDSPPRMPPDAEWILGKPQLWMKEDTAPSFGVPPVCDADLTFLIKFAEQRGAELIPKLRGQVHAAVAAGQSQLAKELRSSCQAGSPPLKGDDNKGDTPDPRIFESFGVLSPPAWAALDYSLSLMEIFCARPTPEDSLLPVSAAVSVTTFFDHIGTADGCVGEARDYTAGIYAFLPYLPANAPGPAGLDLLLDQTAMTAFGRQAPQSGVSYDADVFMHARLIDGAVMGFNAILTAMGCSALPCDELGWWTCSCPSTRPVLEAYMITNDLVDFISDCIHSEPMNLYRNPLLAGASLPEGVERWLKLGPEILQCRCGVTEIMHSDLFHTWVGAMTYNMITPRCRFARTLAWHARNRPSSSDVSIATSFSENFRSFVRSLLLASGTTSTSAESVSNSSTPLFELAAQCTLDLGRELLLLFADCIQNAPADEEVARRASSIYYEWRSLSWCPNGRGLKTYHEALKRDLLLLACSAFVGGTFTTLDAFVRRTEQSVKKEKTVDSMD